MPELLRQLTFSRIITDVLVVCMLIGAIDYFIGNKLGLGKKFEEGFSSFASLAITMVGIITLVPLINKYLAPVVSPLFESIGADPAMFSGMILANDMGGYQLASEMAVSGNAANFGGMLLASMMGVNIVFNIPVALGIISKEDRPYMAKGVLCGFITIPAGGIVGGLIAGYQLTWILINLVPVIIFSALIALLLVFAPRVITKIFIIFGKIVMAVALFGTAYGIFNALTGISFIPDVSPVTEGFDVVISIIIVLPGAYVFVELLSRVLKKPIGKLGGLFGISSDSTVGLITTMANAIPTFSLIHRMDERGKVINFAFIVSAGYLFGDHLAFCTALEPSFVLPMLVGKAISAVTAVALAMFLTRKAK